MGSLCTMSQVCSAPMPDFRLSAPTPALQMAGTPTTTWQNTDTSPSSYL